MCNLLQCFISWRNINLLERSLPFIETTHWNHFFTYILEPFLSGFILCVRAYGAVINKSTFHCHILCHTECTFGYAYPPTRTQMGHLRHENRRCRLMSYWSSIWSRLRARLLLLHVLTSTAKPRSYTMYNSKKSKQYYHESLLFRL